MSQFLKPLVKRKLLLIGCGSLGGSLLKGWQSDLSDTYDFTVVDRTFVSEIVPCFHDLSAVAGKPFDGVVLAVKPESFPDMIGPIKSMLTDNTLLISVMAGVTLKTLAQTGAAFVVRAMPNLPVSIRQGMTVCCGHADHEQTALNIFSSVGDALWLSDESLMDVVTAISGSGPGYLFYVAECLIQAAVSQGLETSAATQLVTQTLAGSAALLKETEASAHVLYEDMARIKGTTAAGLEVLMQDDVLKDLLSKSISSATNRSKELAI